MLLRSCSTRVGLLLVAALASAAAADILHMRDGSRHYGTLVSETADEIVFHVNMADGRSGSIRRFPRNTVDLLEISPVTRPPADTASNANRAAATKPAQEGIAALEQGFAKLDAGERSAALVLIRRAVTSAEPDELAKMEQRTRETRHEELPDLIARVRFEQALPHGRIRVFHLTPPTRYEAEALSCLLECNTRLLLDAEYGGRTIRDWALGDEAYATLRPDARDMVEKARLAAAMIMGRLRCDSTLRHDRDARIALTQLSTALAKLAADVSSLGGFTALGVSDDPNDPGAQAARKIAASQPTSQPASRPSEGATVEPADPAKEDPVP